MNEQDRIARLVFQEMENEKITEKLKIKSGDSEFNLLLNVVIPDLRNC